jgi:hypothetical protein
MGLNLSNPQIAPELELTKDDVAQMTGQLRQGIVPKQPTPTLTDEGECDEVDIVAGHQGQPDEVRKKGGAAGADASRGTVAAGPWHGRSPWSSG